ncbi:MAG: hypothetical protein WAR79_05695 [Melioribacteraceae bacterium]
MAKILCPELLYKFEKNRTNLGGENRKELRNKQLFKVIKQLYTVGWKYDEVINYFTDKKLFISEAKKISTYVFTQDLRYNPFGYWYTFQYEVPLFILRFAIEKIGSATLSEAGVLFALHLLNDSSNIKTSKEKLAEAIGQHTKVKIIEDLTRLSEKKSIILLDRPSTLRIFSDINKETLNKAIVKINRALDTNLSIYFEPYSDIKLRSRAWITGYRKVLKHFKSYCKENKALIKEFNSSIIDITKGGNDILEIDDEILNSNNDKYVTEYDKELNFIQTKTPELLEYYAQCFKKRPFIKLEKFINKYEKTFVDEKYTYLSQIPIKSNRLLRIFKRKRKYFIACQSSFINYGLILSSLYGDQLAAKQNISDNEIIKKLPFDRIPNKKAASVIKSISGCRIQLIKAQIGNHIHPVCSLLDQDQNKHFDQINEVNDVIYKMSNTGITINKEKLKEMQVEVIKRTKLIEKNTDNIVDITDSDFKSMRVTDESNFNGILDNTSLKKLKLLKKKLKQYMSTSTGLRQPNKLYGHFRSHGAKTHRMTCSRMNLQGIPKVISKNIFMASPGYKLLSADVAGQDIAIAANIALKIVNKKSMVEFIERTDEVKEALRKIETVNFTIDYLSIRTFNPIDLITDNVYREFFLKFHDGEGPDWKTIRKFIKQTIYAKFYGGGKKSVLKSKIDKTITLIIDSIDLLIPQIDDNELKAMLQKSRDNGNIIEFSKLKENINELYKKYLMSSEPGNTFLTTFERRLDFLIRLDFLFNTTEDYIKHRLPGTTEIFPILEAYMNQNEYKVTFPSALGWQTVIDPLKSYEYKDRITKSKSYVIQSTGAELIREWILVLSRSEEYRTHQFRILLAIHDQIVIEVLKDKADTVSKLLSSTIVTAANNIGLVGKTFHIPDVKELK